MTWSDLISRRSLDDISFLLIISVYVAYYVIIKNKKIVHNKSQD